MYKSWVPSKKKKTENRSHKYRTEYWFSWFSDLHFFVPFLPSPLQLAVFRVPCQATPFLFQCRLAFGAALGTLHVEEIRRRLFGFNFGLGETTGKGRLTHGGKVNQSIYAQLKSSKNRCFKRKGCIFCLIMMHNIVVSFQISYDRQFEARKVVAEDQDATIQIKNNGMSTDQCMDDMWYSGKVRYIPPLIVWSKKKYQDPFAPRITHDSMHKSKFVYFLLTMEL